MSKFKVGDRVAVYRYSDDRRLGTITCLETESKAVVTLDCGSRVYAHQKQLRKLKPRRKAREWWMTNYPGGQPVVYSDAGDAMSVHIADRLIHVREVLPPKKGRAK